MESHQENNLTDKILETDAYIQRRDRQLSEGRGLRGWVKKCEGSKNILVYVTDSHDNSVATAGGKRARVEAEEGKGAQMGMERELALADGLPMQCVDDILLSRTLETCKALLTYVTPMNPNSK